MRKIQEAWAEYFRTMFAIVAFLVYGFVWFCIILFILNVAVWIVK